MSKGSQIVPVRLKKAMFDEVYDEILLHNERSRHAMWSMSDFIRQAIADKLAHIKRGRKKAKKQHNVDASAEIEARLHSALGRS